MNLAANTALRFSRARDLDCPLAMRSCNRCSILLVGGCRDENQSESLPLNWENFQALPSRCTSTEVVNNQAISFDEALRWNLQIAPVRISTLGSADGTSGLTSHGDRLAIPTVDGLHEVQIIGSKYPVMTGSLCTSRFFGLGQRWVSVWKHMQTWSIRYSSIRVVYMRP